MISDLVFILENWGQAKKQAMDLDCVAAMYGIFKVADPSGWEKEHKNTNRLYPP